MKKNNVVIKLIIFTIAVIVIVILILNTMARYESQGESVGKIEVALYILGTDYQSMNLKLDNMTPREEPYIHNFSISNFNDVGRTDVGIEYTLKIRTTTNLQLGYKLYLSRKGTAMDSVEITGDIIERDADKTYFRTITTAPETFGYAENETNIYKLEIYFPETYKDVKYQDVIESIEIIVTSTQIVD